MNWMPQIAGKKRLAFGALTAVFGTAGKIRSMRLAVLTLAFLVPQHAIVAEQLPMRRYTTADGLASDTVACVKRDSHGFLWFCTSEGLSRFDGYSFTNYSVDQGLPDRFVTAFLETRKGDYWIGTYRGVAHFNPRPGKNQSYFTAYSLADTELAQHVNDLFQDRSDAIWAATSDGLYQLVEAAGKWQFRRMQAGDVAGTQFDSIKEDQEGNLWVAVGDFGDARLLRRRPNGQTEMLTNPYLTRNKITAVFIDHENRIWVSTYLGLALLAAHPTGPENLVARVFTKKDGLLNDVVEAMFQTSDGRLWVGCGGLLEVVQAGKEVRFRVYGPQQQGFGGINAQDIDGNLWMGQTKLTNHGFVNYGKEDGLRADDVRSILEGHDGELYVVTGLHSRYISRFDGKGFVSVAPRAPGHDASWDWSTWGWGQLHFQDHRGEWWVGTGSGIYRYPRVRRLEDLAWTLPQIYSSKEGLEGTGVFRMYEDSKGDVWISEWGAGLLRWERRTDTFHKYGENAGMPHDAFPTAYREDRAGNLWMGMWGHDLVRLRNGHFDPFLREDGFPNGSIFSIFLDHAGRIWAGTSRGGLVRIDEPEKEKPQFRVYTTKDGLSSNDVRSITEDHSGRIYFWTGRGVDRLEPETGAIIHYTSADGLVSAGSDFQQAYCDRQGRLWFGFVGLSRLDPTPASSNPELPIYLTHLRIRGEEMPVSELGESRLSGLVLQPNQNNLQIEFSSLNFGSGETIHFQYKLEDTESEWSTPSTLRRVNYAELRPGRYRFLVRAIRVGGEASPTPAEISFRVLAPIWQRWWFLSGAVFLAGLAIYGLYHYRVEQLLELERMRTRIATDLHDEIGSGLTQIAILSEVIRQDTGGTNSGERLSRVADLSRELIDAMSEIVWAMNPTRDHVGGLVQRMRRFASDVLTGRNIALRFDAREADLNLALRSEIRRQVFLIFKEAVNNVSRHSHCTAAKIEVSVEKGEMLLSLSDDGRGFDVERASNGHGAGHGLNSMKQRAAKIGGTLEITSRLGAGARLFLRVPISQGPFLGFSKTT
jgi:ligand-binding sensor domain-containing protein/two-component sensor histidine kinase